MAENIKPRSPFERAAAQVQSKRVATPEIIIPTQAAAPKRSTAKVRARLNDEPDDDTLNSLIAQALSALSRGVRWARGSILNLIV
ncbi:MAG: hypothetical protein ACKVOE_10255 [Rickettsiales bacterium]